MDIFITSVAVMFGLVAVCVAALLYIGDSGREAVMYWALLAVRRPVRAGRHEDAAFAESGLLMSVSVNDETVQFAPVGGQPPWQVNDRGTVVFDRKAGNGTGGDRELADDSEISSMPDATIIADRVESLFGPELTELAEPVPADADSDLLVSEEDTMYLPASILDSEIAKDESALQIDWEKVALSVTVDGIPRPDLVKTVHADAADADGIAEVADGEIVLDDPEDHRKTYFRASDAIELARVLGEGAGNVLATSAGAFASMTQNRFDQLERKQQEWGSALTEVFREVDRMMRPARGALGSGPEAGESSSYWSCIMPPHAMRDDGKPVNAVADWNALLGEIKGSPFGKAVLAIEACAV